MEEASGGDIIEKASWREASWREASYRRHLEEASWRRHHGGRNNGEDI